MTIEQKQKAIERYRRWRENNCEHMRAYWKKWREEKPNYKEAHKRYREKHRKGKWLSVQMKAKHGITLDEYNAMLAAQNGRCAICFALPEKKRLSIDHCHATLKIRGLLCAPCNHALGFFKDEPKRLREAANYLERAACQFTA